MNDQEYPKYLQTQTVSQLQEILNQLNPETHPTRYQALVHEMSSRLNTPHPTPNHPTPSSIQNHAQNQTQDQTPKSYSTGFALGIGFFTIWPILWAWILFALMLPMVLNQGISHLEELQPVYLILFGIVHFVTMIATLATFVYLIINLVRNSLLSQDSKIIWGVCIFFLGPLATPVYWFKYIWRYRQA